MHRLVLLAIVCFCGCDYFSGRQAQLAAVKAERARAAAQQQLASQSSTAYGKGSRRTPVYIVAWNIESGGSDTRTLIRQMRHLTFNILALSEVPAADADRFKQLGVFTGIAGKTGGEDRLVLSWTERYELVNHFELVKWKDWTLGSQTARAPLVAHLRDIFLPHEEFLIVNNHFARGDASFRNSQAQALVDWASEQTLPIIAVGDYNMDYDFETKQGNEAFALMTQNDVFKWVKPEELIDTNWYDGDGDEMDDYPNSMLDFVFIAGPARNWDVTCRVVLRDGDFPDDQTTSDHRPVMTTIR